MNIGKKLLLTAAACALLLGVQTAAAAPVSSPFSNTDYFYYRLHDPDMFRLLSGMGIPDAGKAAEIDWSAEEKGHKVELAQLFPGLSDTGYFSLPYSGCRTS